MSSFDEGLERYARLLVEQAIGLRAGQRLDIGGETGHRELALRVGDAAYAAGASRVRYRLTDPLETAQLIRRGSPEQIALFHVDRQARLADVLRGRGAYLALEGSAAPGLLAELGRSHPVSHRHFAGGAGVVSHGFYRWSIEHRLSPVVMAVCPTPAWARRVFPGLDDAEACRRLWELVVRFTCCDRDDGLERFARVTRRLEARAAALDALGIRELRIRGGGNDLVVALSEKSRFRGVGMTTSAGQRFLYNVPSFEVFSTPDRRPTEGRLAASRPVCLAEGTVVEGLELEFRAGRVVDFRARRGADAFGRCLEIDDGARYLGEIALVGEDSPVAASGKVFEQRLLDENAAAHVALGMSFAAALDGGTGLTSRELDDAGFNRSALHVDIPFGSTDVDVMAGRSGAGEVPLLEKGLWSQFMNSWPTPCRPAASSSAS